MCPDGQRGGMDDFGDFSMSQRMHTNVLPDVALQTNVELKHGKVRT